MVTNTDYDWPASSSWGSPRCEAGEQWLTATGYIWFLLVLARVSLLSSTSW